MTEHLSETARGQLETMSDDQRRAFMGAQRWLGYPAASRAVKMISELQVRQRSNRTQGLAVLGPYRNGKSMVADKVMGQKTAQSRPTYYYQLPTEPSRIDFLSGMVRSMGRLPDPGRRSIEGRRQQLEELLDEYEPRVFIFDDAHHAFRGACAKEMHTLIRVMGHRWDTSPVLVGDRSLGEILHLDPELRTRFDICPLRRWNCDDEFAALLSSLIRVLPLRLPSDLLSAPIAERIFRLSEGLIGEIVKIITEAAAHAVGEEERVSLSILDSLDYLPLSRRFAPKDLRGLD